MSDEHARWPHCQVAWLWPLADVHACRPQPSGESLPGMELFSGPNVEVCDSFRNQANFHQMAAANKHALERLRLVTQTCPKNRW